MATQKKTRHSLRTLYAQSISQQSVWRNSARLGANRGNVVSITGYSEIERRKMEEEKVEIIKEGDRLYLKFQDGSYGALRADKNGYIYVEVYDQ
jgi:hypothetical protein